MIVFLLQHSYPLEDGICETKILGIYDSHEKAEMAINALRNKPGFRDHVNDFYIDKFRINETDWLEGFITPE